VGFWQRLFGRALPPAPEPSPAEPIEIAAMGPPGPEEQRMLESIQSGEENGRSIYADWLEGNSRLSEAEYVRAELALQAAGLLPEGAARQEAFGLAVLRVRTAGLRVAVEFKAYLSRPSLEKCVQRFELKCPQKWSALKLTSNPRERHCEICRQTVSFCATVEEAREHALEGHCVAVEVTEIRHRYDLDPPPMAVGSVAVRRDGD
jgi:uncharacterized protein (TIGR02996 family)